jgi:hypothetical protein
MLIILPSRFSISSRPLSSRVLCFVALSAIAASGASTDAHAQSPNFAPPPQAQANPVCQRLIGQLAAVDNGGGGDAGKADQIRRYEESANRQQAELERIQGQARRQGCDSSGFFSLFTGQTSQCGPINNQLQQMRSNLDQITTNLGRLRAGSPVDAEREGQRRSVLLALAQNNCGPQYANAARGAGNFLDNLFGNVNPGGDNGAPASTYRTVCARSCDGFYFPISFATVPSRFADDERVCKSLCPAAEATLFTYRNPGEDMNQAVSISGQPYSSSPNAFRYRQIFDKNCSCKGAGQTWSEALKNIDDQSTLGQGDIIVTDERAKKMAQPPKPATPASKKNAAATDPSDTTAVSPDPSTPKPMRSVGPTFIQTR